MSGVTIYMEGGGNRNRRKNRLEKGVDGFLGALRQKVLAGRRNWRVVPCGDRARAWKGFANAREHADSDEIVVLLVDSEGPVTTPTSVEHLRTRQGDGWDMAGVPADRVHLMVQTMETWIVADPEELAKYYGRGFDGNALPKATDLETVDKAVIADALARATRRTGKGGYDKIEHASDLLARIDPAKARHRCRHCDRLFSALARAI